MAVNEKEIKGEPGTGFEERGVPGPFECWNCEYLDYGGANDACNMVVQITDPLLIFI